MENDKKMIADNSAVWMREEGKKSFYYANPLKVAAFLKDKKKIYTLSESHQETLITKCEYCGQFDLYEFKTFSGSRIICSELLEFLVDNIWVVLHEINFHENIMELNILNNHFKESYAISIKKAVNIKAYSLETADNTALINNFLVKLD